ncbi:MAG: hypothetical protein GX626_02875, partial [Spirochaetales bacterium]|nr:hypothetical protein [Spirochaetales bacterium]
ARYTDKDVGSSKSITVSYTLSGTDANNYMAPGDTVVADGVITQKQLTVTNFDLVSTKEYDGSASSTINNVACSGIVPTDDVQVSATATYTSPTAGTNKPITVMYALSGADSANYRKPADSIATATGEIARKQLSVSGTTVANKDYDGTTLASLSSQGMLGGVVVGNTVTFTAVGTYDTKHAGENKDVTVAYTLSGSDKDNYLAPANAVLTGTIHKKLLTAKDIDVTDNKEYDGTIDADLNACTIEGIVAGDTVTVQKTATYDTALAGTNKIITVAFGLDGIDKDNYIKPADVEVTSVGVITKKQLMVSGTSLTTKDFNGTTNAPIFSQGRLEGIVDGDQVTFTAIANYATKDAGLNKSATVVYTLSGADKDNYLAPADGTLTGTIHKKLLTATSIGVTGTKEYDGTRNATITACTINGIVDVASVTVQKAATYDTKLAGSGKAITVSFSLEGADKDSYIEPDSRVVYSSGVIHQKQLAVSGTLYSTTKVYDGTANIPITSNGTLQGVVQGDVVALNTVTGSYANSDAGTEKAFVIRYTLRGVDAANYTVPDLTGTSGTILKAVLTATVGEHSRAYGAANPDFPVSVSGFVNGETASTASGYVEPTASTSATATTSAGTKSTITISGGSATNYSFNITDTGTLTITKAAMTGTVSITGSPVFGQVLTAVPDLANTGTPAYQWKRDGVAISGASGTTYTLAEVDIGKKITVTATATGTNYSGSITSEETVVTKTAGSALSGTFEAYYPIVSATQSNITQDIINLTGFTANQTGIEASISTDGTSYENYSDLVIDSRGRAMISITSAKKVKLRYEETSTQSAGADLLLSVGAKDLAVGDYYAGGVVGYIYQSTDTAVYIANQVHGLIAAKSDTSDGIKWSSNITLQVGTAVEIGTGLTNTQAIIAALDGSEVGRYAAKEANSMRDGGYDDWFLPSFNELQRLRDNRILVGNFHTYNSSAYMSSSESTQKTTLYPPNKYYHAVFFDRNDDVLNVWDKGSGAHIRAIRYF